jgi:hypothetical protein
MAITITILPSNVSALSSGSSQPVFSNPVNLSNDGSSAQFPNVQSNGMHVYVSWTEGSNGIKFRSSQDGGRTWSSTQTISNGVSGNAQYPLISESGKNVYVVWSQGISSSQVEIYVASSIDYGVNFNVPVQVTSGSGPWVTPVIASWGKNVYLAYILNVGTFAAYTTCSSNFGAAGSWTTQRHIGDREPQIAAWGGKYVYVVVDWSVFVSSNNCATWVNHTPSDWPKGILIPREPWIWAYGSNVYVAWETGGSTSVVESVVSNNYGSSWSSPVDLTSSIPDSWAPMVWAYGSSAWIGLREYPGGAKGTVWVLTSTDGGSSWSQHSVSGTGAKGSAETFPYTVRSSNGRNVFVAWSHQVSTGYWTFTVSYSGDGGNTWTPAPGITVSTNKNGEAGFENDVATGSISSNGIHCYAVWQFTSGTTNQVYFAHS